jgi:hypothetical protein
MREVAMTLEKIVRGVERVSGRGKSCRRETMVTV